MQEGEETYPCMAVLGDEMSACPDWTPLEPRFRCRGTLRELVALPKVVLYCHSLDVGLAKVTACAACAGRGLPGPRCQ